MKKITAVIIVLALVLTSAFCLVSCSGGSDAKNETKASEQASSAEITESASAQKGAGYLPLNVDNVMDYVHEVYGYDYIDMGNMSVGAGENNTIHFSFEMGGKYYYYEFKCDTGEVTKSYEGVDEMPAEMTEAPKTTSDYALDACLKLLDGYVENGEEWPDDINIKRGSDSDIIVVSLTWRGESYEFEYDMNEDKAIQTKP